jgi:hypothetical protein
VSGWVRSLPPLALAALAACNGPRHDAEPAPAPPAAESAPGGASLSGVRRMAGDAPPGGVAGPDSAGTAADAPRAAPASVERPSARSPTVTPTAPADAALPASAAPAAAAPASAAPSAALPAPAAPSGPDVELAPALLAADGTPLPQTRERPETSSAGFQRRLERLVDAIANDDPERALPAFFPRVAYQLVKAIPDPGRDWDTRLVRAFRRDIHDYHRLLGPDAAGARLAGIVLKDRAVRWMDPGAEGNRLGYYRVTRSSVQLRLANGATRELELTSLISWRGAWYVVHLHGFS